jgi:hypothetical protein
MDRIDGYFHAARLGSSWEKAAGLNPGLNPFDETLSGRLPAFLFICSPISWPEQYP